MAETNSRLAARDFLWGIGAGLAVPPKGFMFGGDRTCFRGLIFQSNWERPTYGRFTDGDGSRRVGTWLL